MFGKSFSTSARRRFLDRLARCERGYVDADEVSDADEIEPLLRKEELDLPGRHNVENLMAATGAAILAGADLKGMEGIVRNFQSLPHAIEKVAEVRGVHFYNDSRATNIQAVKAGIESFNTGLLLILGGRFKGGDFRELRELVVSKVKHILALGESRQLIVEALNDVVPISECGSLDEVVQTAFEHAHSGDTVLFSPAGSSFDMFTDYCERGEAFREAVEVLRMRVEKGTTVEGRAGTRVPARKKGFGKR